MWLAVETDSHGNADASIPKPLIEINRPTFGKAVSRNIDCTTALTGQLGGGSTADYATRRTRCWDERFPVDGGVFDIPSAAEVLVRVDPPLPVRVAYCILAIHYLT